MDRFADGVAYLTQITGTVPLLRPMPDATRKLPLFLRQLYAVQELELFGHTIALAATTTDAAHTPAELAKHHNLLQNALPIPVALVLPETTATYNRNRLVRQGVPFIVPNRHLYMPMLFVDLREGMRHRIEPHARLSASAQVAVLYRLLHGPVDAFTLAEVAQKLGYSAMTLTKIAQELNAHELAQTVRQGRKLHLHFPVAGQELWELAKPLLQSPVKETYWAQVAPGVALPFVAGISALAKVSSLLPDAQPVLALPGKRVQELRREEMLQFYPDAAQAVFSLQVWRYDPAPLAEGECVDRLSLYLSLRDSSDERVRLALHEMMEKIAWQP